MKLLLILLTTFIPFVSFLQKTGTLVLSGDADYYGYDKSEFIVHYNQEVLGRFDKDGNFSYSSEQKGPFIIKHPDFESLTVADISFSKYNPSQYVFQKITPEAKKRHLELFKTEQSNTCTGSSKKDIDVFAIDSMASFPGGDYAMSKFLSEHIIYPQAAVELGITGKVYLTFIVEADGSITCIEVKRGADYLLDREAFRCLKSFPKFIPATHKGVPVPIIISLPVNFNLN